MASSRTASTVLKVDGRSVTIAPGNLLVKPDNSALELGGIVVSGATKTRVGELVACGDLIFEMPDYPIGSTIYYVKTNGLEVELNGVLFVMVYFSDVKLVIEP